MSKIPGNSKKGKWINSPFRGLKKALEEKGVSPASPRPSSSPGSPDRHPPQGPGPREESVDSGTPVSDEELFLKAMEDIREITEFRDMEADPKRPRFKKHLPGEDAEELMRSVLQQKTGLKLSDMDEYDEWVPPGGRNDLVKRLHRGECSVQDYIDLHGLIEDEAEAELVEFLEDSRRRGFSCVKVIHGRGLRSPGEPVLKLMVSRLLKGALSKHVRAYATAPPKDGGLGATYILLKGK